MTNQSRRTLLKTIAYGATLVTTGIASSNLLASTLAVEKVACTTNTINIHQQKSHGKDIVSIMNLGDKSVSIDRNNPISLESINGSLVVKLTPTQDDTFSINAGERLAFEISHGFNQNAIIYSEHPAFNGIIPVS